MPLTPCRGVNGYASSVAFFPVYPLVVRTLSIGGPLEVTWTAVIVSQLAFIACCVVLLRYVRVTRPTTSTTFAAYVLMAMGLFPPGLFFRCVHAESLFLFLSLMALYGLQRGWPLWCCALIVGLATGTRPTGVVLLAPLAIIAIGRDERWAKRAISLAYSLPLACWGLLAYMLFLWLQFGDPLAFVESHANHRVRRDASWDLKAWELCTLKTMRAVYDPSSAAYWATLNTRVPALFSIQFANPGYFMLALVLAAIGKAKGWLDWAETSLVVGLMFMPYLTRSYDMGFAAMGRFASVAFPIYLVMGQILVRLPVGVSTMIFVLMGVLLAMYAAQFSAGYYII